MASYCCLTFAYVEPSLIIDQENVLNGEHVEISVTGLRPGQEIRIKAERVQGHQRWKQFFKSEATFTANSRGKVQLSQDRPTSGTWDSVDATGLFWSMSATDLPVPEGQSREVVQISVDFDKDGIFDATKELRLRRGNDDLIETSLGDEFPGAFLLHPPSEARLPTVLLLGGSGGHDWAVRITAPMLASRGFAVVGIPYFSPSSFGPPVFPALPRDFNEIPIDRLEAILTQLKKNQVVDLDRLAIHGTSKGAEFALAAAARMDRFKAVVAIVPSDVVWEGFTGAAQALPSGGSSFSWRQKPLPFVPMTVLEEAIEKHQISAPLLISKATRQAIQDSPSTFKRARIQVENIRCPVLLAGGGQDQVADCGYAAKRIKVTRDKAGNLQTELYFSEKAGHAVAGTPYDPTSASNAALRKIAFPAKITFLKQYLELAN